MKKTLNFIFAAALSLLFLAACSEKEDDKADSYDDSHYAAQARISSSDPSFTATSDGGTILFNAEGGTVTVYVSCGTSWLVENSDADAFSTSMTGTTLDVTAGQNSLSEELTATITFRTVNQRITFATLTVVQSAYGSIEISVETNEWNVPAAGDLTTEIGVSATADWTVEVDDRWLTAERADAGVRLTAEENPDPTERSSRVTLICSDGVTTVYEYITVNQAAGVYINLSPGSVSFGTEESSSVVAVESNYDWDFSYDEGNGWFTVSRSGNDLTVSVASNEGGDNRSGVVTLTAGDGAENIIEAQLKVSQAGVSDMIMTYTTSVTNTTVRLPLYGEVDCTVDWGDGSEPETVRTTQPSHIYAEPGEYDITIGGTVTGLYGENLSSAAFPVTAVKQWGRTGLTSLAYSFYGNSRLASIPDDTADSFTDVTSFKAAFYNCESLAEIPAGLFEHSSNATDFSFIFYGCTKLKAVPSGLFDNCTSAETFYAIFYGCAALDELPAGLFAECWNVTDLGYIIYGCKALKSLPTEGIFGNHPKLESLKAAFYNCTSLEELPAGLFDGCGAKTDPQFLFYGCEALKTLPSGLFDSFTAAEGFSSTFSGCSGLETVPDGLFDKCTEITSLSYTFRGCESLKKIPENFLVNNTKLTDFYQAFYRCFSVTEIPENLFANCADADDFSLAFGYTDITKIPENLFANCTKVTTFYSVFSYCSSLTEIPEKLFANCPDVESFSYSFRSCSALTSIPAGLFSNNLKVTNFSYAFRDDKALTGESPYDLVNGSKVHLYERSSHTDIYAKPSSTTSCFLNCTGLSDYDDIPSGWGGGN